LANRRDRRFWRPWQAAHAERWPVTELAFDRSSGHGSRYLPIHHKPQQCRRQGAQHHDRGSGSPFYATAACGEEEGRADRHRDGTTGCQHKAEEEFVSGGDEGCDQPGGSPAGRSSSSPARSLRHRLSLPRRVRPAHRPAATDPVAPRFSRCNKPVSETKPWHYSLKRSPLGSYQGVSCAIAVYRFHATSISSGAAASQVSSTPSSHSM
jgi:hypothetical protein